MRVALPSSCCLAEVVERTIKHFATSIAYHPERVIETTMMMRLVVLFNLFFAAAASAVVDTSSAFVQQHIQRVMAEHMANGPLPVGYSFTVTFDGDMKVPNSFSLDTTEEDSCSGEVVSSAEDFMSVALNQQVNYMCTEQVIDTGDNTTTPGDDDDDDDDDGNSDNLDGNGSDDDDDGLSGGAIAGIVLAVLAVVGIAGFFIYSNMTAAGEAAAKETKTTTTGKTGELMEEAPMGDVQT